MPQDQETLAAKIESFITEWEEKTGAILVFNLFTAEFGGSQGAREALCQYLAQKLAQKEQ